MAVDPTNETNRNQIDILIQNKKDEIADLEEMKKDFSDDDSQELRTPADVAADPDVSAEERAAAASATTGQDPATVNAEQSEPSPSTDAEKFGSQEAEQESEKKEEAEDEDAKKPEGDQGVEVPSGRGDVNRLGDPETEGYGETPDKTDEEKPKKKASKKASAKKD